MIYLEDTIANHRKALDAGGEAMWLWVCCLGYCHQQASEGVVPRRVLRGFVSVSRPLLRAKRLVEVGLLEDKGDHFYVHDWYPFNRKADERRAQARRAAQVRWGKARSESNADADAGAMPEHDASADAESMPEHMREQSGRNASRARHNPKEPNNQPPLPPHDTASEPPESGGGISESERIIATAFDMWARRQLRAQPPGAVRAEHAWVRAKVNDLLTNHGERALGLFDDRPDLTAGELADLLEETRATPVDGTVAAQRERIRRDEAARSTEDGEVMDPSHFDEFRDSLSGNSKPTPSSEEPF